MLCSRCHKNEATIFGKELVNNKIKEFALCLECARAVNVPAVSSGSPIFDLLSVLGSPWKKTSKKQILQCPQCNLKYEEFRKSGLLGCSECYRNFDRQIRDILKHIHGTILHKGKKPPRESITAFSNTSKKQATATSASYKNIEELKFLRKKLEIAIKLEKFEEAAKLRDRIRELEKT